jgi:tetratricopeptide (TPR) repeat protein
MMEDRHGFSLSTGSLAARDAYARGSELLLTLYPGAMEAFDSAIAEDPNFALAYAGKAQVEMRQGNGAAARQAMGEANARTGGISAREASHIEFFDQLCSGRTEAALKALRAHLREWPRDALVLTTAATPNGLIGASGRIGQKREIAALMDSVAPYYGDDWWFLAHHAMALSENGQRDAARPRIERSLEANPKNANAAHARAHVYYEDGDADGGRAFLASWLRKYPRDGFFHGHLSWHRALGELQAGEVETAFRLHRDAFTPETHSGSPQQKVTDAISFLWRSELAGAPRDDATWRMMHAFAASALPGPGNSLADTHVLLAAAVTGDDAALDARVRRIEELVRVGRYASGAFVPAAARGFVAFERGDFSAAADALGSCVTEIERSGGSRAQLDLIEFTLLKACVASGRTEDARRWRDARRAGPSGIPVAGVAASR